MTELDSQLQALNDIVATAKDAIVNAEKNT